MTKLEAIALFMEWKSTHGQVPAPILRKRAKTNAISEENHSFRMTNVIDI